MADRERIAQVLGNLLANAARQSPEALPICIAAVGEDVHVAVSVADQGQGMAPERLAHLFRKHAGTGESEAGGSGLGLAICKGLVEARGGRIRARKRRAVGSSFCGRPHARRLPGSRRPRSRQAVRFRSIRVAMTGW